ncbi:MAG: hypothetical protein M3270_10760 [Thermoproteota archaeon]|nr:hypothetical protein [Thermoproteota archaeon]
MTLIIRLALLTGLRPSEAIESARLINDKEAITHYCDDKQMTLNQCDIPKDHKKKAYLSYITSDNLQPMIAELGPKTPTWTAIRLACRRRNISMDMHLCRKIMLLGYINAKCLTS